MNFLTMIYFQFIIILYYYIKITIFIKILKFENLLYKVLEIMEILYYLFYKIYLILPINFNQDIRAYKII